MALAPREYGDVNVRYWHKADIPIAAMDVAFGGKADMASASQNVRL